MATEYSNHYITVDVLEVKINELKKQILEYKITRPWDVKKLQAKLQGYVRQYVKIKERHNPRRLGGTGNKWRNKSHVLKEEW